MSSERTVSIEYAASLHEALEKAEAEMTALKDLAIADITRTEKGSLMR